MPISQQVSTRTLKLFQPIASFYVRYQQEKAIINLSLTSHSLPLTKFNRPSRYRVTPQPNREQPLRTRFKRLLQTCALAFITGSIVLVALLRVVPTPVSAFMLHRHIDDWVEGSGYRAIDHRWIDRSRISRHALAAAVAAEDQLFYRHNGFDLHAIDRAMDTYLDGGRLRGASTISQQVAKNLFLSPAKSLWRKAFEVWFTVLIEVLWSKERILEMYLNVAEFGDHLFGVEAASRRYFDIPARNLSAPQAALLAATLPNPLKLRADRPSAYVYKRQRWILNQMRNLPQS